jgi:hypothetical protein
MRKIVIAASGLLLLCQLAKAQSFAGFHTSNYAGIYGVSTNPAAAAGTRYKWDVNIIGADVKAGNTYASFTKSALLHQPESYVRGRDYFLDTSASRKQYGWGIGEIMMPSVLYSIDERQSVAFTWRIRGVGNAGNVETPVANFFGIDFPNPSYTGRNYNIDYANVAGQSWNEFGFSYARVIKDDGENRWKAGVTIKYLSGIAAGYGAVDDATFVMNTRRDATISRGTLKVGYSEAVDNWEKPDYKNFKLFGNPGVGLDLGVIYEWRPDGGDGFADYDADAWNPDASTYKLRIGASVTDIGGIFYKKAPASSDVDLTIDHISPDSLKYKKNEGWQRYYRRVRDYFTPVPTYDGFFMATPAAVHLSGDYNIDGRFFISANAVVGLLTGTKDDSKNYVVTQLQVTPHFDVRNFGAYLPLVINRFGQANAGIGLRAGPLVIGSASIITNLLRSTINRADGFIALRVPLIRLKGGESRGGRYGNQLKQVACPPN